MLRLRPRNDLSGHGGDPWIAPSEFELIKNRATIVKVRAALDWHVLWRSRCWQGGGAASVGGYPCPLAFDTMSTVTRSTTPNFRAQEGYLCHRAFVHLTAKSNAVQPIALITNMVRAYSPPYGKRNHDGRVRVFDAC